VLEFWIFLFDRITIKLKLVLIKSFQVLNKYSWIIKNLKKLQVWK